MDHLAEQAKLEAAVKKSIINSVEPDDIKIAEVLKKDGVYSLNTVDFKSGKYRKDIVDFIANDFINKIQEEFVQSLKSVLEQDKSQTSVVSKEANYVENFSYDGEEGKFTGEFSYGEKGEIIKFSLLGKTEPFSVLKLRNLTLKDDWEKIFLKNGFGVFGTQEVALASDAIKVTAETIGIYKKILGRLDPGSQEYVFLENIIKQELKTLQKRYEKFGDLWK